MERVHFGDEQFYAAFGAHQLTDTIQTCPSDNQVGWMCHSDSCKASVYCGLNSCEHCRDKHDYCGSRTRRIGLTTNQLNQLLVKKRELIENIRQIDHKFVCNIVQTQRDMVSNSPFEDLRKESQEIVKLLYKNPQKRNISGKQSKMFMEDICDLNKHYEHQIPDLIVWYGEQMERLTKEAFRIKKKVLKALDPQARQYKEPFLLDVSKIKMKSEMIPDRVMDRKQQVQRISEVYEEKIIINEKSKAQILFEEAKQMTIEKKNQQAIKIYRQLLKIDPTNLKAHNNLGVILSFYKRYNDTLICFEKAIIIDPLNVAAYNNIQVLFKSINDQKLLKRATEMMEGVIKKDPRNEMARETLQRLKVKSKTK